MLFPWDLFIHVICLRFNISLLNNRRRLLRDVPPGLPRASICARSEAELFMGTFHSDQEQRRLDSASEEWSSSHTVAWCVAEVEVPGQIKNTSFALKLDLYCSDLNYGICIKRFLYRTKAEEKKEALSKYISSEENPRSKPTGLHCVRGEGDNWKGLISTNKCRISSIPTGRYYVEDAMLEDNEEFYPDHSLFCQP